MWSLPSCPKTKTNLSGFLALLNCSLGPQVVIRPASRGSKRNRLRSVEYRCLQRSDDDATKFTLAESGAQGNFLPEPNVR
jgi:hypothetical protein